MKAIAYQVHADNSDENAEDGWETIATVRLKPDGSIAFDGPQNLIADNEAEFGINTSILAPCWNPDLKPVVDKGDGEMGRMVSMADGVLFLDTLEQFRCDSYARFIALEENPNQQNRPPPAK